MVKFAIVAIDGCYGSSLHGLVDVLVVANSYIKKQTANQEDYFSWQFFNASEQNIATSNGLVMQQPLPQSCDTQFDVVFIPGIIYRGYSEFQGQLKGQQALYQWLKTQHSNGAKICANCTATFFVAESGLLSNEQNNLQATSIWWLEHLFKKWYPQISLNFERLIVEQHNIITAGAATSHFQLGLHLLKQFTSEYIVQQTAKAMLIDTRRINVHSEQLLNLSREHNNRIVQDAQEWIDDHIQQTFTLKQLCADLATTERTLTRQFKKVLDISPMQYIKGLRLNRAKYLLETSELSLEQIISKVGYKDRSAFSKLFAEKTGLPPITYRRQYAKQDN